MKKQLVIIMKNPGTSCNIGCIYCAEERKQYCSVDNVITFQQAELLSKLTKDYALNVLFHGGEPMLLSTDYYLGIMKIFERMNNDVYFGIQTNGTLLDDSWIKLLKNNRDKVGISISLDGSRYVNSYRLTKDKKETYDIVYNNIKKLEKNGINTGLICTIVKLSLGREQELYDMLMGLNNLQFVKLNPCMDRNEDGSVPFWGITPRQYFGFVSNFFDIMFKNAKWSCFYVEPIVSILKNIQGIKTGFCNYTTEKCSNFISVYPDGTITSCDNFNLKDGYVGKIEEVTDIETIRHFQKNPSLLASYNSLLAECSSCSYSNYCKGGCIAARQRYVDTSEYCESMRGLISHIEGAYRIIHESLRP